MSKPASRCVIVASMFVTLACNEPDPRCARLPSGGRYCLQPTSALAAFDAQQIAEISVDGRKETLVIEMESGPDGLRFVGLTPFGFKLLQLQFDNKHASVTSSAGSHLDPVLLASLLQLTLWPAEIVRKGLDPEMSLEESGSYRRIFYRNEAVLIATRIGSKPPFERLHLSIPAVKLEIDIKSLDGTPDTEIEP